MKINNVNAYGSDSILGMNRDPISEKFDEERSIKNHLKGKVYSAFSEYIEYLEKLLQLEEDSYFRMLLAREIKELKKERQKYYVPSTLEMKSPKSGSSEQMSRQKKMCFKN